MHCSTKSVQEDQRVAEGPKVDFRPALLVYNLNHRHIQDLKKKNQGLSYLVDECHIIRKYNVLMI